MNHFQKMYEYFKNLQKIANKKDTFCGYFPRNYPVYLLIPRFWDTTDFYKPTGIKKP